MEIIPEPPVQKTSISSMLSSNPYFSAGFGLMGLGASLALLKQFSIHGLTHAKRHLLVTLEISSRDKSYNWFLHWMAKQQSRSSHHLAVETSFKQFDNGSVASGVRFIPGPGNHFLRYAGIWIKIQRERQGKLIDLTTGAPWETVTLTTLSRDRDIFQILLKEAQEMAMRNQQGKTVIFISWGTEWKQFGQPRRKRLLDSVILDTGIKEKIISDVQDFLKSEKWYADRGIPYRRGYLLYGPPGSGKSSFIQALAGHLDYNICILNLSTRGLTDDRLNHLLTNVPEQSILLLEDIDAAFSGRSQSDDQGYQSGVTFSGLLNALDGVASCEERLIFMTTNHVQILEDALIRPGRVDMKQAIDNASYTQAKQMFLRFFEGRENDADEFAERVCGLEKKVSTASLQGLFVYNKHDPRRCIELVEELGK
ncbi:Mitochondrial chaperone BCS1 [Neolecta irregularis DAH-3]|uniref:Mitochondrial chaperone BCS1 n=1 Tax=Neolecta irregularis (strain DAH-3) TaxID=1198029 RepID=A0A1U7LJ97_NEOID|nr:Mitochondrial chaperone BCS1 [Neolecta irregularis DAH-3]|eukprot:OLL22730.1 Mitochondrial chaperone BCS1 [Neolecta irregularis DAH-3]